MPEVLDIIEDFSPVTQGDTGAAFKPQFRYKDKSKGPVDLTDTAISMVMQNRDNPEDVKATTGEWVTDDAENGLAHFNYGDEDVDTPGVWNLIIVITDDITHRPVHADSKRLRILPLIEPTP